jgi:hypothetical protein
MVVIILKIELFSVTIVIGHTKAKGLLSSIGEELTKSFITQGFLIVNFVVKYSGVNLLC